MYNIMLNGEYTLDAENNRINYRTKEDAMAAVSYFDLGPEDDYCIYHYTQVLELEALIRELEQKAYKE